MIEKQRLEELSKQGATIWHIIGKIIFDLNANDVYTFYTVSDENWDTLKDEYYETKEDAEFALRYKRIPKTVYLDLPTWEEAKDGIEYQFYAPKGNIYLLSTKIKVGYSVDKENPYIIRVERIGYSNSEQDFELTKENYIEVCKLCKKLFLGEEV